MQKCKLKLYFFQTNRSEIKLTDEEEKFKAVGFGSFQCVFLSAVEAHTCALVQVHVGVTEETLGHAFHVSRDLIGQLGGRHFKVRADLWAEVHLWDVEAIHLS